MSCMRYSIGLDSIRFDSVYIAIPFADGNKRRDDTEGVKITIRRSAAFSFAIRTLPYSGIFPLCCASSS